MIWHRVPGTLYAIRSECGRWQISKAGRGGLTTYSLWDNQAPLRRGRFGQSYREAVGCFRADHYGGAEAALKAAKEFAQMLDANARAKVQTEMQDVA